MDELYLLLKVEKLQLELLQLKFIKYFIRIHKILGNGAGKIQEFYTLTKCGGGNKLKSLCKGLSCKSLDLI